jgi:hypothetical protein
VPAMLDVLHRSGAEGKTRDQSGGENAGAAPGPSGGGAEQDIDVLEPAVGSCCWR